VGNGGALRPILIIAAGVIVAGLAVGLLARIAGG
jgi:hypothetical protein